MPYLQIWLELIDALRLGHQIVREDLRGSGVGSAVLELMEEKILTYGVKHIYLWTEGEKNFYGKRGYQLIDQLIKPGRVIDLMQKDLGK